MPDLDANEDPIRMPDARQGDSLDPGLILSPTVRRMRELPCGHLAVRSSTPVRRVGVTLVAQRRRSNRRACPFGRRVSVLGTPLRHRRRLWTLCHGQAPGSPS